MPGVPECFADELVAVLEADSDGESEFEFAKLEENVPPRGR